MFEFCAIMGMLVWAMFGMIVGTIITNKRPEYLFDVMMVIIGPYSLALIAYSIGTGIGRGYPFDWSGYVLIFMVIIISIFFINGVKETYKFFKTNNRITKPKEKNMKTAREILTEWNESKGYGTSDNELLETLTEGKLVHSELGAEHRWYIEESNVVQVDEHLLRYNGYCTTGDNCASDMGLDIELDDVQVVEKKTRTIVETYYESQKD